MLKDPSGKELKVEWKTVKPDELEVKLPLREAKAGPMSLWVTQNGQAVAQPVPLQTYEEAGHYDGFVLHSGDAQGLLKGSRLDEVVGLSIGSLAFVPGELTSRNGSDELRMTAQDVQAAAALKQDRALAAKVALKDGRLLPLTASVDAPRPRVLLLGKSVLPSVSSKESNIQLTGQGVLPLDATLTFALRSQSPAAFARDEIIEVATDDESSAAVLSFGNGGVTLENAQVAVATLNPAKAFGASAFGALQFRVVLKGVAGGLAAPGQPGAPARAQGSHLSRDAGTGLQAVRLASLSGALRRQQSAVHQSRAGPRGFPGIGAARPASGRRPALREAAR